MRVLLLLQLQENLQNVEAARWASRMKAVRLQSVAPERQQPRREKQLRRVFHRTSAEPLLHSGEAAAKLGKEPLERDLRECPWRTPGNTSSSQGGNLIIHREFGKTLRTAVRQ